ncbi:hypothetical protein M422DRAFT_276476 [Sphaerobolus stellatus SS14]|uniref:Shikimate dehydrogenase substrate binding N-terminal domain-containing protein n=1 Tax=Sphaerobolus stellatus (strain SS14) TaxID=990650 RepID=A0A0C9UD63_SPHS4|nr:hypothetical protein M422DRAFT_276476 [Sphaerobolus stellatus SS14]
MTGSPLDSWDAVPWSPVPNINKVVQVFFEHITGPNPNLCPGFAPGRRSYFLSLAYPDIIPAVPLMEELSYDGNAKAPNVPSLGYVAAQVVALCRNTLLSIIYTIRTVSQGGLFPDDGEEAALALMNLGIRMGCEYIDVEISWSAKLQDAVEATKGASQIIASWHDWSGNMRWDGADVREKYARAAEFGDIVKIIGKANTVADNFTLQLSTSEMTSKPLIAINMGQARQKSRILNTILTPVTYPSLYTKATPGQLSVAEIQRVLHLLGLLLKKRFYLFGSPISQSMSPTIYNTGFETLGLPYHHDLYETEVIDEKIKEILKSPDFGGASVTIPLKLDIVPLLDGVSPAAKLIGAVNTIVVRTTEDCTRTLHGDNTDWMGIAACIKERLSRCTKSLVIGGGGTSRAAVYALHNLGATTIYLYNRTRSTAEK